MNLPQKTVVFFGDSLTRADYLSGGFVDLLAERCKSIRVLNRGVNGDTSYDLLARVSEVQAHRPDMVYLMVGTNDCGMGVPPEEYKANLDALVRALQPAEIVMVTPTTSVYFPGGNASYVRAVKDVASVHGARVVDFAAEIADADYGFDGLHWNEKGHRRLADAIMREAPPCEEARS